MVHVEEEEAATAEVIVAAVTAEVIVAAVTVAVIVAAVTAEVIVAAVTAEVIVAAVTAGVILNLIALILINLLDQKVGKTEAMEILLKILNLKAVEVGEKEEFLMRATLQMRQIRNPFL